MLPDCFWVKASVHGLGVHPSDVRTCVHLTKREMKCVTYQMYTHAYF